MIPKSKWYIYECNADRFAGYWILYQQLGDKYYKIAHSLLEKKFICGVAKKVKLTLKEIDILEEDVALKKRNGNHVTFPISEKKAKKIIKELKYKNVGKIE